MGHNRMGHDRMDYTRFPTSSPGAAGIFVPQVPPGFIQLPMVQG